MFTGLWVALASRGSRCRSSTAPFDVGGESRTREVEGAPSIPDVMDRSRDRDRPSAAPAWSMPCPKCRGMLHGVDHDGVSVHQCLRCDGRWFDGSSLSRLPPFDPTTLWPANARPPARPTRWHCPRCWSPLVTTPHDPESAGLSTAARRVAGSGSVRAASPPLEASWRSR